MQQLLKLCLTLQMSCGGSFSSFESFDGGVTAACIAASAETVDRGMQGLDSIFESDSDSEDCEEMEMDDTGKFKSTFYG